MDPFLNYLITNADEGEFQLFVVLCRFLYNFTADGCVVSHQHVVNAILAGRIHPQIGDFVLKIEN